MVIISAIVCLVMIHSLGSVGIGTIIAALLVGMNLGFITKLLGHKRDLLLNGEIKWYNIQKNYKQQSQY